MSTLDGENELRNDGEDAISTLLQEIVQTLDRNERVRFLGFDQTGKEEGKVVVVVQLVNIHLSIWKEEDKAFQESLIIKT